MSREIRETAGERVRELEAEVEAMINKRSGARTPSETAISILAEVIAVRTGRTGESLRETSGPIHPEAAADAGAR